jgi:amino acid transporter
MCATDWASIDRNSSLTFIGLYSALNIPHQAGAQESSLEMEDQAAIGAVAVMLLFIFLGIGLMRANVITGAFMRSMRTALRTRTAMVSGIVLLMALLLYGIAHFGLVNSLPAEQHVERNRDSNRLVITEDKNGCVDARTLGRSNGVYMALAPCKPGGKNKSGQTQQQQN